MVTLVLASERIKDVLTIYTFLLRHIAKDSMQCSMRSASCAGMAMRCDEGVSVCRMIWLPT